MMSYCLSLTILCSVLALSALNGMQPNTQNDYLNAKLSIENNDVDCLKMILKHNSLDANQFKKLLRVAVKNDRLKCFKEALILCSNEKLDVTTIFIDIINKHSPELLEVLLSDPGVKIDVNCIRKQGSGSDTITPLIFLVKRYKEKKASNKRKMCLKLLLSHPNIDLTVKDSHGKSFENYADDDVKKMYMKIIRKQLIA